MKRFALCFGLLFLPLGVSLKAHAFADVAQGGNTCSPVKETSPSIFARINNAGWSISPTDYLSLSCPVARPLPSSTKVWPVVYVQGIANKTLTCTFVVSDVYGVVMKSVSKSTSSAGNQPLYFGDITHAGAGWGSYGLSCTLPPLARIHGYYVYDY